MAAVEFSDQRDKIVLWPATGGFDEYSRPTVGSPVEINGRWSDTSKERLQPDGTTITIDATAIVKQDIKVGSRMWLGTLAAWYANGSAQQDDRLMYVHTFKSVPDMKRRFTLRTVDLMRWRGKVS